MDLKRNNPVSIVVMAVLFWLKNILLWLDQGLNVLLMGDPDETVSRRAGRARLPRPGPGQSLTRNCEQDRLTAGGLARNV